MAVMDKFLKALKQTQLEQNNRSVTENGALGYRTTGKELLDMNFAVSSMRNMGEQQIVERFIKVFYENRLLAVKWLFYVSDVRQGMGERRLFRICLRYLAESHREIAEAVIPLIPEYNRWDNLLCLLDTELAGSVAKVMAQQLCEDMTAMTENKPVSLLAKWMPSVNASSPETRRLARILISYMGISQGEYRKMLSGLREYLKVTEVAMSKGEWAEIDYTAVPSRANLIYRNAFLRHDEERRRAYLKGLQEGKETIHSGVLFPQDIVHSYYANSWSPRLKPGEDTALEELWKALPDFVQGNGKTICVADGSGSMCSRVGATDVNCLQVANALAIYFSERCSGALKDCYITFSSHPQFVQLGQAHSLREKLEIASCHNEVANTNIEAVFELLLNTAVAGGLSQEEMPDNILILSDMEFDSCAEGSGDRGKPNQVMFRILANRYAAQGYRLPRLVFWNICSRTNTIPIRKNDLGVALVSGFSPAVMKMVLSNRTDPLECLLDEINSARYAEVERVVRLAETNKGDFQPENGVKCPTA